MRHETYPLHLETLLLQIKYNSWVILLEQVHIAFNNIYVKKPAYIYLRIIVERKHYYILF